MCVVRDTVNFAIDEHLATFVVESHRKSHPDAEGTLEDLAECDNTTSFAGREEPVSCCGSAARRLLCGWVECAWNF